MSTQTLVCRSKQKIWPALVLLPATALLGYMTYVSGAPDFEVHGRGAGLINALGPTGAPWFFGLCAAICAVCTGLVLYRRLAPKDELIMTQDSVTSNLFWGRGTLPWGSIVQLKRQKNFLFIHGIDARGKKRKLTADLGGLNAPEREILGAIETRRPDLFL